MDDYFFSSRPGFPWSIYPFGIPALIAVAVLLALFTIWTYLGHPQATRRRVLIVLTLRLLALSLVLITAARPTVGKNENPKQPSQLIVLVDMSESMTVKDELGGQARIDAVRKTLEKCKPLIDELAAEHGITTVIYKFGSPDFNETTSIWDPTTPADAKRSDYGVPLNRGFKPWQPANGPRVRAILVIGDGAENGEGLSAQDEAVRWGRNGTKIYTFLTGRDDSDPEAKDISATAVECDPSPAYIKNKITVTARVNAFNFPNAKVTARVTINDQVTQQNFELKLVKNELKIPDVKTPDKPGEYKVKVEVGIEENGKIKPLEGELSGLNNSSETYLTVLKEGVRVLIVDQLRWEETLFRRALANEKRFDVSEVIRQTDLTPTAAERELLKLEDQAYDVVIIGNVSAAHLNKVSPQFLTKLAELVEKKGVGVMFLGGEYGFHGYPDKLLPITAPKDPKDPTKSAITDDLDKSGNPKRTYPVVPTTAGIEKMFRVTGKPGEAPKPGASEELWDKMNNFRTGIGLTGYTQLSFTPGLYSVFAWTTSNLDPQLIKAGGDAKGDPILVGAQRGDATKGRWLAFAAYDTYLWRSLGQFDKPKTDEGIQMHERFWRQCVLWLAHQDEADGAIEVVPQFRQMKVTQAQTIRIKARKPNGEEDTDAPLTVYLTPLAQGAAEPKPEDDKKGQVLTVTADKDGRKVEISKNKLTPGEYFVAVTTPVKDAKGQVIMEDDPKQPGQKRQKLHRGTAKFIAVPDVSDEMLFINANQDFMQKLAIPTGGKAMRLDDLPGFLSEMKSEAPDITKKPRYYPDWRRNNSRGFLPLWLVLFALLLGAEWGLRRLWGMV